MTVTSVHATAVPVRLPYAPIEHLGQVYAGFQRLESQGVVTLTWTTPRSGSPERDDLERMILRAEVGEQIVRYDLNDGTNAFGDRESTLATFAERRYEGWLFRRSHHDDVTAACGDGVRVLPLGVNYFVKPGYVPSLPGDIRPPLVVRAKDAVRRLPLVADALHLDRKDQGPEAFESGPALAGTHRVLLSTRLWDPQDALAVQLGYTQDRVRVNAERIELVARAREMFGDRVTAGLATDEYSSRNAPAELLLPAGRTRKDAYLASVREHAICVASRGLHSSTGWRFGEYVAASRAIVTERLAFDPGPALRPGRNYVEYTNVDEALARIGALLEDPAAVVAMMSANRTAYDLALRPDALVLRTMLIALGHGDPVDR